MNNKLFRLGHEVFCIQRFTNFVHEAVTFAATHKVVFTPSASTKPVRTCAALTSNLVALFVSEAALAEWLQLIGRHFIFPRPGEK